MYVAWRGLWITEVLLVAKVFSQHILDLTNFVFFVEHTTFLESGLLLLSDTKIEIQNILLVV
jgi:hypothetical protein